MAGKPDWKPVKRHRADKDTWTLLRDRLGRVYVSCQCCGKPGSEAHHLVPRAQSGSDEFANLAWLCPACHQSITERKDGARGKLRGNLSRIQLAYVADTAGDAWLAENYPLGGGLDAAEPSTERAAVIAESVEADHQRAARSTCPACNRRLPGEKKEKPRNRRVVSITVPADEREQGADVLDELLDACEESLRAELGYEGERTRYHVVVAVLADWLNSRGKAIAA